MSESDSSGSYSRTEEPKNSQEGFPMNRTNSLPNIFHPKSLEIGFESDLASPEEEKNPEPMMRRHQSQMVIAPPKPPRDPARMSSAFSTNSLPTTEGLGPRQNTTLFIWKEPPKEEKKPVRSHRRKDAQKHARRHTLQGGIDVSMVEYNLTYDCAQFPTIFFSF